MTQRAQPAGIRKWVEYLALEIGRRPAVRVDLLRKVAERLTDTFIDLGYEVSHQPVPYRQTHHLNVIARPRGSMDVPPGGPLLVVGAHYDSVSASPGADDNASAVAGLVEMARLLADNPPPGLRLAAFCPEEPPAYRTRKMGSYIYAKSLKEAGVGLTGMICLEMIGYFTDAPGSQSYPLPLMYMIYPKEGNFIAIVGNIRSTKWTRQVRNAFAAGTDLPVECLNAPAIMLGIDFSDHWSFNKFGYPAAMVTDTAFYRNPHYHLPSDLPDTLDYFRAAKVVDGVTAAVRLLA
ncbi:MAG: M28 family peptidase [Desulfobulbaceae bacterium]|nr:M28 family peptidase [Desulfobulbaceae bacterium]